MKKFTKILMAVAAVFAVSCTTDVTEDLGVQLGNEGQTTITLSLEESRTHLGEKAGDLYPLYWSEGDQIAVNGVASLPLTETSSGKAAATFSVSGELAYPYNIVYPAPAEGVVAGEGLQAVTFLSSQPYKAGSFAEGAAPMYAQVANADEVINLKHLSGVLCFSVKGNGEVISSMTVKALNGKIAGNFDVNCDKGTLTAHEDATNVVNVSFTGGLTLGSEATPIYVAVPAGSHGQFMVTLYTVNDRMTVKFNSDVKPITVGTVREFNEFVYMPNEADTDSQIFEIDSKEALIEFARIASTFYPRTEAKVVAEIDMTGVEWSPIEGFAYNFDGGNFAIKGLSAPLFGHSTATIKNVKLTDVNINSNNRLHVGAVVCNLRNNETSTNTLSNCEVSGSITVSNPGFVPASSYSSTYDVVSCGGVAGFIFGVPVSDCTNHVNITITQIAQEGSASKFCPTIGGIAGYANGSEDTALTHFSGCKNYGAIAYNDNSTERSLRPTMGGILGLGASANLTNLTNCVNHGALSVNALCYGSTGAGSGEYVGGITGRISAGTITSCKNEATGTITMDGDLTSPCVGGIAGYTNNTTTTLCDNLGAIEFKSTARFMGVLVGGVSGCSYDDADGTGHMEQCTNDASIKLLGSTREGATPPSSKAYYYRVGGVSGFPRHAVVNCENKANGDILIEGNIVNMTTNTEVAINIAGCAAYMTQGAISESVNRGDITINADFSLNQTTIDNQKTSEQPLNIAGVVCYDSYNPHHLENYGNISFGGSFTGYRAFIGGLVADGFNQNICPNNSTNHGTITIEESASFNLSNYLYIGGIIGITERNKSDLTNMTNNGAINFNGTMVAGSLRMGGFTGYVKSYFSNVTNNAPITFGATSTTRFTQVGGLVGYFAKGTKGSLSNLINTENGDITLNGAINGSLRLSGCIADKLAYEHTIDNCVNSGDLTVNSNITGLLTLGGNVALMASTGDKDDSGKAVVHKDTFTNFTNNGKITVNNVVVDGVTRIGGCVGSADLSDELVLTNCTNNGAISVKGTYNASDGDNSFNVGGIVAVMQGANNHDTLLNSETGDITIDATTTKTRIRVGGVAAKMQDGSLNLTNKGDISIAGSYPSSVCVSGIVALTNGYNRTNLLNEGNITVSASGVTLYLGGIYTYGAWDYGQKNVVNKGNLTVTKDAVFTNSVYMGGMITLRTNTKSGSGQPMKFTNGCYNSGNMTFNGKCSTAEGAETSAYNLYMGGMVGQSGAETTESYGIRADGFVNKGNFTFGGSVQKGSVYIGGIAGDMGQKMSTTYWTGTLTNVGNITSTGSYADKCYIGGIIGAAANPFANAECYATIHATQYTGMGLITGSSRSATMTASNCKVGGYITAYDEDDDSYTPKAVSEDNYYNYIYGSGEATDWTGTDNYDGCTFLSAKPTIQ